MWNETMDQENGAGWAGGESSFMTDRKPDTKVATLGDRLPVPVTITDLNEHFSTQDDKYVIGNFRFATVMTVGIVKDINDDGTTFSYNLHDPSNPDVECRIAKYGTDGSSFDPTAITEGTRVRAIGKLKRFDEGTLIMLFNVVPMDDDKDFKIFELEAQVARLFFSKNVSDKMKTEDSSKFQGMLAPPRNRNAQNSQGSQSTDTKDRIYPQTKQENSGAVKQKARDHNASFKERVVAVLRGVPEDARQEGKHVSWIADQVDEKDHEKIRTLMAELIEGGFAYTTTDDETYSVI